MPVINSQSSPHAPSASTTTPTNDPLVQHRATPERIKPMLKAGPNWTATPKAPDRPRSTVPPSETSPSKQEADATKSLLNLNTALTPEIIREIQNDPNSSKSRTITSEFDKLLHPNNVKSLSRGPNARKNVPVLREIGNKLDKKKIESNLDASKNHVASDTLDKFRLGIVQAIISSFDGELWGPVNQFKSSLEQLGDIRKNFSDMESRSKKFVDTGMSLSDAKVDETPETQGPATYSFNNLSESTLNAPSEIRNFNSEDKLDLSGIQRQLNRPLQRVERTPEAIGEMQIHHAPDTNTSVVVVADAPHKPPFVLKVFGEVRASNIVT
ncbi:M10 family metallopeptidase C-terminal domain-containing protein [Pseudomonas sp. AM4(2022)]|uniref:M10 family metallopeptidase C-terminal domain-containing protein n=1 Tax=Pseudomonas sp. AM4(2022) TaxID=2983408 RepID=UPI002E803012|nr:hypothetical protein [Pseudomonas sp. AM4(2022)]